MRKEKGARFSYRLEMLQFFKKFLNGIDLIFLRVAIVEKE
jgi:hypothetical protein